MQIHLVPGRFDGHTAIVTGAAGGIGQATAARLGAEGAKVLCLDVQGDAVAGTAAAIEANGGVARSMAVDVTDSQACAAAVDDAVANWGSLDVLCNVAGILRSAHTAEVTDDSWRLTMSVNLDGAFYMSRAALPHLLSTRGAIVNVSSTAGVMGQAYLAAYCASKHGLIGLTRAMAVEYARDGLRVNAVCPGGTATSLTENITFPDDANFHLITRAMLVDEPSTPEGIATLICYAASPEATYMNGSVLNIDAGVTAG